MKISLAQIKPKLSKDNIQKHIRYIDRAIRDNANIVIFPELSLNGYMLMDLVYEDAYDVKELQIFEELSLQIDIIVGTALRVGHKIYNSAVYFSKGKVINVYHKNSLPNYGMFQEARFFFAGDSLELFETRFGSAVTVICEDLWNSKIIDKIVSLKPDMIYVLSASPSRGFGEEGLEIEQRWQSILSTTSSLSGTYTVFVNRVGYEDGLGFWGGSRVVNPKGILQTKAKLFEEELLSVKLDRQLSYTQKYLLRINN